MTTAIYRVYFRCPCNNSMEPSDHCDFPSLEEAVEALTHMSGAMRIENISLEEDLVELGRE